MKEFFSLLKKIDTFSINLLKNTLLICVILSVANIYLSVFTADKAYSFYELYYFSRNVTTSIPVVIFEAVIIALGVDIFVKRYGKDKDKV